MLKFAPVRWVVIASFGAISSTVALVTLQKKKTIIDEGKQQKQCNYNLQNIICTVVLWSLYKYNQNINQRDHHCNETIT